MIVRLMQRDREQCRSRIAWEVRNCDRLKRIYFASRASRVRANETTALRSTRTRTQRQQDNFRADHFNSTKVVTNASCTVIQALDYYPYGSTHIIQTTDGFNEGKQFIAQYTDTETNLSSLQARYYDGRKFCQNCSFLLLIQCRRVSLFLTISCIDGPKRLRVFLVWAACSG